MNRRVKSVVVIAVGAVFAYLLACFEVLSSLDIRNLVSYRVLKPGASTQPLTFPVLDAAGAVYWELWGRSRVVEAGLADLSVRKYVVERVVFAREGDELLDEARALSLMQDLLCGRSNDPDPVKELSGKERQRIGQEMVRVRESCS